jgi:hypothetical protein
MTDEMDGKARKMSVTSSDGRNSMCIAAIRKRFDTEEDMFLRVVDLFYRL